MGISLFSSQGANQRPITAGLRKGPTANKTALLLESSTLAFLFRKPTTLNTQCGQITKNHNRR